MDKNEIIKEFLNNSIQDIKDEIVAHVRCMYNEDNPYDIDYLDELNSNIDFLQTFYNI